VRQLAHIERRQARIRRIRQTSAKSPPTEQTDAEGPGDKYCIGKDEKTPYDIGSFLRLHSGDPAVKVRCIFPPEIHR
jgi:hypothetical protein